MATRKSARKRIKKDLDFDPSSSSSSIDVSTVSNGEGKLSKSTTSTSKTKWFYKVVNREEEERKEKEAAYVDPGLRQSKLKALEFLIEKSERGEKEKREKERETKKKKSLIAKNKNMKRKRDNSSASRSSSVHPVNIVPTPFVGVGLSGLGFGPDLPPRGMSKIEVRNYANRLFALLPLSLEKKNNIIEAAKKSNFDWTFIDDGWYYGGWTKNKTKYKQSKKKAGKNKNRSMETKVQEKEENGEEKRTERETEREEVQEEEQQEEEEEEEEKRKVEEEGSEGEEVRKTDREEADNGMDEAEEEDEGAEESACDEDETCANLLFPNARRKKKESFEDESKELDLHASGYETFNPEAMATDLPLSSTDKPSEMLNCDLDSDRMFAEAVAVHVNRRTLRSRAKSEEVQHSNRYQQPQLQQAKLKNPLHLGISDSQNSQTASTSSSFSFSSSSSSYPSSSSSSFSRRGCGSGGWRINGPGIYLRTDEIHVGHCENGSIFDERGVLIDATGIFCGEMKKGIDDGNGCYFFKQKSDVMTGFLKEGECLYGSSLYCDALILYTGQFVHNKPDGWGISDYYNKPVLTPTYGTPPTLSPPSETWLEYEGYYSKGKFCGFGRLILTNGQRITGTWLDDTLQPGTVYLMEWKEEGYKPDGTSVEMIVKSVVCLGADAKIVGWGESRWEENKYKAALDSINRKRREAADLRRQQHNKRVEFDFTGFQPLEPRPAADYQLNSFLKELNRPTSRVIGSLGSTYRGFFVNGSMEGWGIRLWDNGDMYEGEWLKGICNGLGRWRSVGKGQIDSRETEEKDIVLYEGGWKDDREHGNGIMIQTETNVEYGRLMYRGKFHSGRLSGLSLIHFLHNGKLNYIGEVFKSTFHGYGLLAFPNDSLYIGYFKDDVCHGEGVWIDTEKCSVTKGRWTEDEMIGVGTFTKHFRFRQTREKENSPATISQQQILGDKEEQQMEEEKLYEEVNWNERNGTHSSRKKNARFLAPPDKDDLFAAAFDEMNKLPRLLLRAIPPFPSLPSLDRESSSSSFKFPESFDIPYARYLVMFEEGEPVFRLVTNNLDDLLAEIGYDERKMQDDTAKRKREELLRLQRKEIEVEKRGKLTKKRDLAEKLTSFTPSQQLLQQSNPTALGNEGTESKSIVSAGVEEEAGSTFLSRLSWLHKQVALLSHRKVGDRHRTSRHDIEPMNQPSLALLHSLLAPLPTSELFADAPLYPPSLSSPSPLISDSSSVVAERNPYRCIFLERCVALCRHHQVCTFAVTGHLDADSSLLLCSTCTSAENNQFSTKGNQPGIRICRACLTAGCHEGHSITPMGKKQPRNERAGTDEKQKSATDKHSCGSDVDGNSMSWCECGASGDCKTLKGERMEMIYRENSFALDGELIRKHLGFIKSQQNKEEHGEEKVSIMREIERRQADANASSLFPSTGMERNDSSYLNGDVLYGVDDLDLTLDDNDDELIWQKGEDGKWKQVPKLRLMDQQND